ncbi:hypothetical protein PSTG_17214 [Puccinia striiformis f. sp. tritici PST-78]|uniref:Uncharacterized protein n=1 Tax=Puccinia striiformis f. sp. tritici PST-78 TaxID=1165861 RepID=A0A0L0URD3_9BASI|nr:hypothetical protein PSTG_17214 [Puccinia striiformis f. sp. tritici PST-78]
MDPQEVPQLCAIWCAQAAQPFAALGDTSHQGIIHPVVLKNLPSHKKVSNDIARLYMAMQESLIKSLKKHQGAMHLGLDAWQSPSIFNIFQERRQWLLSLGGDFVKLQQSHAGLYLAKTVQLIIEKFGLKDKICGIVMENASNNQTMIEEIKTYRWPRFKGETQWHKKNMSNNDELNQDKLEDSGDQICFITAEYEEDDTAETNCLDSLILSDKFSNPDPVGCQTHRTRLVQQLLGHLVQALVDDDEVELEDDDVNELSDEDEYDWYTSQSCKTTLAKFCAISRKLNKSPNSKALFVDICRDIKCPRPHNVGRDVCTWWNSTLAQLSSIVRCLQAINDIDLARDLVEVLQPFYEITLQVLIRGGARIADIAVFIDQITSHLSTAISNKQDEYPPALRNACRASLRSLTHE